MIALAVLILCIGASRADPPAFEQLRWTAPGAGYALLSEQPSACLASEEPRVRSGRALFATPTLLGGQAAKAGLSCASCHINGRGNPHFLLAGVSAVPGTADVSNSFFSAVRGNGRFDPVTIPDLAMPGKVSRDAQTKALEPFVRNLIVEEFGGEEPTPAMLDAIATYVRAVARCNLDMPQRRGLIDQLRALDDGMAGAALMLERGDRAGVRLSIAAIRHQLGLIAERYPGSRSDLLSASRALQALGDGNGGLPALRRWKDGFDRGLAQKLRRDEGRSLYDAVQLRKALTRR